MANSRRSEVEHEQHVVGVAKLIDTVGKTMQDAGLPPRVIALQAQMTCSHFGVTLEEAAEAHIIPWTTHYPSAMDDLQKQDPRLYAYCVQNSYKVQKSDHGLIVTGGPDKDDPLNCMGFELFRAITYAIWEDRIGDLNLPTLLRDFGEEDEAL